MSQSEPGIFTISLDTELAWGTFDTENGYHPYEEAYRRTPQIVRELCSLFEQYEIPAMWAVVAHLFEDCDGHHGAPAVDLEWVDDWYGSLPCQTGVDRDLWYSPEILETIQSCTVEQEIGLHGYTHLILGAPSCQQRAAEYELMSALDVCEDFGITPSSFAFPRNMIGHLDTLADSGIDAYRGRDNIWFERWNIPRFVRKPFRFATEALSWTPPSASPRYYYDITEIPGSQVFRPLHGGWEYTPGWTQFKRAKKGLDRAVSTGGVFHLRFHPFDFGFDETYLLAVFERVLEYAATLREQDLLEINSLSTIDPRRSR